MPGVEVNFPRPGDEERELVEQPRQPLGHPHGSTREIPAREASPSQPAAPALRASPPARPPLSAPAAAAPQQPPEQQPRPRAGPSRHTAGLRSLSRCFIALQPRSPLLFLGSLAPLPAPAPPSEALSSGPAPREEATRPSRNGANIATPSRASAGRARPGGRPRPISGRRGPGWPSGARPAPPAPSCRRRAVPAGARCGRATWDLIARGFSWTPSRYL